MSAPRRYSVVVAKDYLKFAAAHFIAYPGFREPLHGHNYQVSVRVEADLGPDGYVLDFGLVKRVAKALCEELDERVLLPERSDCLVLTRTEDAVEVRTEAGHRFRFPAADVRLLPIAHSSAEERAAGCHRLYAPGSMTLAMWKVQIARMREEFTRRGMPWLAPDEERVLVDYLAAHAGRS